MKEHEEMITWWKLAIEMIVDEKQSEWSGISAENVAGEIYARYYSLGVPPFEALVRTCDDYLTGWRESMPCEGPSTYFFDGLPDIDEIDLCSDLNAKSTLLKAHASKMDAYIERSYKYSESGGEFE